MSSPKKNRIAVPGGRAVADHFWNAGIECYVAGRQAFFAGLVKIAGNIFHHAIEFMLKGQLAIREDYRDFFRDYGHDLSRAWRAVKKNFPTNELDPFDLFILELDSFEDIRYPDLLIEHGALISVGFGGSPQRLLADGRGGAGCC